MNRTTTCLHLATLTLPLAVCGLSAFPVWSQDMEFRQLSETVFLDEALGSAASPFGRFGHDIGAVGDTSGDGNGDVVFGMINVPDPEKGYIYASKPLLMVYDPAKGAYAPDRAFTAAAEPRIFVRRAQIADFTGDGRGDVFLGTTGGDGIWPFPECGERNSIIVNETTGWRDASAGLPENADYTHGMASADFNADGATDMLVINSEYINGEGCGEGHDFTNATYLLQFNLDPAAAADGRQIQTWLKDLGFDPGPIDGQPGRKTAAALNAFYASRGGAFDGTLDLNEAQDLGAAFAAKTGASGAPQAVIAKMDLKGPQAYIDLKPEKGIEWENYSGLTHDVDGDAIPEIFLGSGDRTMILSADEPLRYDLAAKFDHPAEFVSAIESEDCQRVQSGKCATPVSDFIAFDLDGDGQDEVISAMTSGKWEGRYFQVFDLVDGAWQDITAQVFPAQAPAIGENSAWCWTLWAMDLTGDGTKELLCANGANFSPSTLGQIWINEAGVLRTLVDAKRPQLYGQLKKISEVPQKRQAEMDKLGYQISLSGVAKIDGKDTLLFVEKFWMPPDQQTVGEIRLYGLALK